MPPQQTSPPVGRGTPPPHGRGTPPPTPYPPQRLRRLDPRAYGAPPRPQGRLPKIQANLVLPPPQMHHDRYAYEGFDYNLFCLKMVCYGAFRSIAVPGLIFVFLQCFVKKVVAETENLLL